ncbi:hypothetical protein [Kosakonia radicincitans]|uniref:hypothetical protein n=1 Tax=Kosakonia radicincitans TaxID=283686 RepID=UPI0022B2AE57|nr:hypothetical protein [Kosakonia radicincitans]
MNIDSVKKLVASLEAAGELTIKERIYLYSMKEHIALKEQNAALAAENAALESNLMFWDAEDPESPYDHPDEIASECEMDYGTEFTVQVAARMPNRVYRVVSALEYSTEVELVEGGEVKTPATDTFLASMRAEGVDMAIQHLHSKFEGTGNIGVPVMALEWLAAQLRSQSEQVKGVQS